MGASWFFYLGFANDLVAIAMFFIPIIPALQYRNKVQPVIWDFKQILSTFAFLGIGVGIHQVLSSFGGLSSFFQLLFGNELIMISTNVLFALLLLKEEVPNERLEEQPVA
jgi:hypothetical protein